MPGGAVFINYRRADSGYAGRLRDHLTDYFGEDRVFMDVGILGGEDWIEAIERALSRSGALLAVIGPNWSPERLADPGDRLRQELEAAMRLDVPIIPVLVGGTRMPAEETLPPSIRALTRAQAVRLGDDGWDDDVRRLAGRVAQLIGFRVARTETTHGDDRKGNPLVGVISAVVVLAILAGIGYVIYQVISEGSIGANPKIALSPTSGPAGTKLTVTGTGFPHNTDITIILMGPVGETTSDGNGSFRTTIEVPQTPFTGIQEVWAQGGAFTDTAQFRIEGS